MKYYNPCLDNRTQFEKMTKDHLDAINDMEYPTPAAHGGDLNDPDAAHPHNLMSSLLEDGSHSPALDIDIPMEVIPSSTEGHCHVLFPTVNLDWDDYRELLGALAKAGIIDQAYLDHSLDRGQTLLRTNGCVKIHSTKSNRTKKKEAKANVKANT